MHVDVDTLLDCLWGGGMSTCWIEGWVLKGMYSASRLCYEWCMQMSISVRSFRASIQGNNLLKSGLMLMLKQLNTFVALYKVFQHKKHKLKPFCVHFDYNKNCEIKCLSVREACCLFSAVFLSPLPALLRSVLFGHSVLFHCESSPYLFTVVVCH